MRILLISDVHANFAALDAVLFDARDFDEIWCLGDVVGYGPKPNECINRLRGFKFVCLAGNHDLAVAGKAPLWDFSKDAQSAIFWTRHALSISNLNWLETLPDKPLDMGYGVTLVHGSPRDPVWEYIADCETARDNLSFVQTHACFNGHTHYPIIFRKPWDGIRVVEETLPVNHPLRLQPHDRFFINPGSVGQPRDEDPRAAYAIVDLERMTLTHHRVLYDVSATQNAMKQEKLPSRLIRRLRFGQ